MLRHSWIKLAFFIGLFAGIQFTAPGTASAQLSAPRTLTASTGRLATLEEQLINRLRATREDQRAYLRFLVQQVKEEKLETRLVVAVERYAIRRRPDYPFPFFERAMRVQALKYGIAMPPVKAFASTISLD